MDSIKRGLIFFQQTWRMARSLPGSFRPYEYFYAAGLGGSLVFLAPLVLCVLLLGTTRGGQILIGVLAAVLICVLLLAGSVFSAIAIPPVHAALTGNAEPVAPAWKALRSSGLDLAGVGIAATVYEILHIFIPSKRRTSAENRPVTSPRALWIEAVYLIYPIMMVEGLSLKDSLNRANQIVGNNLILMKPGVVGVKWVTAILDILLAAIGVGFGWLAGKGVAGLLHGSAAGVSLGIGVGGLVACAFFLAAITVGAWLSATYATSLFLWILDVERSRQPGASGPAVPPAPLAAALARISSLSAPMYN